MEPKYKKNQDGDLEKTITIPKEDIETKKARITEIDVKIDAHLQQAENDIAPLRKEKSELLVDVQGAESQGVKVDEILPVNENILTDEPAG